MNSPGLCTTGGTSVGSTALSGTGYPATVLSPTAYVTSAGRYCWRAVWSGDGTYTPNPQFVPTAPGTYHWVAVYSGSSPNTLGTTHNAACTDVDEDVVVSSVASSMTTAQSWVPNDSATISAPAGGNLAGKVYFTLYATADCSGDPVYDTPDGVTIAGASPQVASTSNTTAVTTSGTFSWSVRYDSTNDAQRDIPASCHETSALTITNGGTVTSP